MEEPMNNPPTTNRGQKYTLKEVSDYDSLCEDLMNIEVNPDVYLLQEVGHEVIYMIADISRNRISAAKKEAVREFVDFAKRTEFTPDIMYAHDYTGEGIHECLDSSVAAYLSGEEPK